MQRWATTAFPRNCKDDAELYANREVKYSRIVHCEMNAILNARESMEGYTLYTTPFCSCDRCAPHVIQAGIKRCVAPPLPARLEDRWLASVKATQAIFAEAGVELVFIGEGNA